MNRPYGMTEEELQVYKDAVGEHWAKVVYFLLWLENHDKNAMYGSYSVDEVVDSVAFILNKDPNEMRDLIDA